MKKNIFFLLLFFMIPTTSIAGTNFLGAVSNSNGGGANVVYSFLSGTIPSSLTFTRASNAWYYNSSGLITQASSNTARFDYNPSTKVLNGLLIEQQSTNLNIDSQTFTTGWTINQGATSADNVYVSPDGATNASSLVMTTAASSGVYQFITTTASQAYTFSVFIKLISGSSTTFRFGDDSAGTAYFQINPQNMTAGYIGPQATSYSIQNVGNGWYRLSCSFVATGASSSFLMFNEDTSNTLTLAVYGAQAEAIPFSTSYIPTAGSAVTRVQDSVTVPVSTVGANATAGTALAEIMFETSIPSGSAAGYGNNYIWDFGTNQMSMRLYIATASFGTLGGTTTPPWLPSAGSIYKVAGAWSGGNTAISALNGVVGSQISNTASIGTTLRLGNYGGGGYSENGWLRNFKFWNSTLTNAQLQQVTQ